MATFDVSQGYSSTPLTYQSSQTNPYAANYQGSMTYAPKSVPQQISYQTSQPGIVPPPWTTAPKPASAPQPTAPSGGNQISRQQALDKGWDVNNLPGGYSLAPEAQGPQMSNEDLMNQINSAYEPQMGYLNQAESSLRSDFPTIQKEIGAQTAANSATLAANKQKTLGGIEKNVAGGKAKKEDALAQARRLFAGLQRGTTARFGGASSAGQAVSEIQGQEMQRQMGTSERDFGRFMQENEAQKMQVEQDYNAKALELETQKQSAINQATRDFQSKLLQIAGLKAEAESNKAMMRVQALQDLKNKVFAVNQQNTQFLQSLQQLKYQQQLSLDTYNKTAGGMTAPSYVAGNINLSQAGQTSSANQPVSQYAGAISRRPEDMYGFQSIPRA